MQLSVPCPWQSRQRALPPGPCEPTSEVRAPSQRGLLWLLHFTFVKELVSPGDWLQSDCPCFQPRGHPNSLQVEITKTLLFPQSVELQYQNVFFSSVEGKWPVIPPLQETTVSVIVISPTLPDFLTIGILTIGLFNNWTF